MQQLYATRGSLDSLLVRLVERELADLESPDPGANPQVARVLRTAFDRSHRGSKVSRYPAEPETEERTHP